MYFREYDIIIDTIEENADADWKNVETVLMKKLGLGSGQIGSIFRDYYPEDITINNYFKNRKAYKTMDAIMANLNEPKEEIALQFGYTDYTVFFKWLKKIYGKNPTQIIEEKSFNYPSVMHAKDVISNDASLSPDNFVTKRTGDYKWNEMLIVDRITALRDRISELKKEMRNETDRKRLKDIEGEIFKLNNRIAEEEERLDLQVQEPVVIQSLTPGLYAEFVKIEECRTVYGISINRIIELYNESIEHNIPLDDLCDIFSEEEFISDIDDYDEDEYFDYLDNMDPDMSYLEDEMSYEEAWQYYKDDDAIDPYGDLEGSEEYNYIIDLAEEYTHEY